MVTKGYSRSKYGNVDDIMSALVDAPTNAYAAGKVANSNKSECLFTTKERSATVCDTDVEFFPQTRYFQVTSDMDLWLEEKSVAE